MLSHLVPRYVHVLPLIAGASFATGAVPSAAEQRETAADIIAAHIRTQGYACDKALGAVRIRRASRPDQAVWTLRCSNASYRVRLIPNMAAQVEKLEQ
ncbi:MAG TPA: hypothetical protein VFA64_09915 [Hyphomicrobiaceae bacterium]|nr:hypothetical protein [Hyphomicrobiaceae bacterium]